MDRAAKEKVVSEFKEIFNSSEIIIAVHYAGLDAVAINSLRKETYENKVSFRVTKNRLIKLAIEKTPYDHIVELFKGPTAIAYSGDIVAASKIINKFSKNNDNLSIIGGALKDKVIDLEGIKDLAALPSLEEIRAKLVAMIATPATKILMVVSAPGSQLARVINAYSLDKSKKQPNQESKAEEKPAEELKVEEKPVEESKAEEKLVVESKAEEKPAEESKVEEKPLVESKAEEQTKN